MRQNINELMSIRRLEVSLKRQDQSLLDQGLAKIRQELDQGYVFNEVAAWQNFLEKIEQEGYSEDVKSKIRDVVKDILSKAGPSDIYFKNRVIFLFSSRLYSEDAGEQFQKQLEGLRQEYPWVEKQINLEKLLDYLSLFQWNRDALEAGLISDVSAKVNNLAGLFNTLASAIHYISQQQLYPVASSFKEFLEKEEKVVTLITRDPSLSLENTLYQMNQPYRYVGLPSGIGEEGGGVSLLKLNGSLNWFICEKCGQWEKSGFREPLLSAVTFACPHCGGACYPAMGSMKLSGEPLRGMMWEAYYRLQEAPIIFLYDPAYEETAYLNELLKYALRDFKKKLIIYCREDTFRWWQTQFADYPAEILKAEEEWTEFLHHQMALESA